MFLANTSVKNPYLAVIVNLVIIIFGLLSLQSIPVNDSPNIDFPAVFIYAVYPGVSSETIETQLLKPLEDELNTLPGVKMMNGYANQGDASINIFFDLEVGGDKAFNAVKEAISNVQLPLNAKIQSVSK